MSPVIHVFLLSILDGQGREVNGRETAQKLSMNDIKVEMSQADKPLLYHVSLEDFFDKQLLPFRRKLKQIAFSLSAKEP